MCVCRLGGGVHLTRRTQPDGPHLSSPIRKMILVAYKYVAHPGYHPLQAAGDGHRSLSLRGRGVTREKGMILGERRYVEQGCGAAPSRIAPGEVQPDYGGSSDPVCPVPCLGRPGQYPGYLLDSQRAGVGVWPVRHDCAVVVLRVRRRVLSGGAGEVPATAKAGGGAAGCAATRRRSGSYSPAGEGKFFFTMIGRVRRAGARHHPSAHHGRAGRGAGAGPHPRTAGRDGRR